MMMEVLNKYPKAAEVVRKYYLEVMLESLNTEELPENFKDYVREKGLSNEDIAKMLDAAPRGLFDAFDDNGIFIEISVSNTDFSYKIYPRDVKFLDVKWYKTRREAEKVAVIDAFKVLEDALTDTE
jgi:uncharacterized membrane protein